MNYEQMSDFEINKSVAGALGVKWYIVAGRMITGSDGSYTDYCNNPADAWPVIVDNGIGIEQNHSQTKWIARSFSVGLTEQAYAFVDKNPLRAAMIVFLMMRKASA